MSVKSNLFSRLTRTRLLFPLLLIVLLLPALYFYATRPKETAAWWNESWIYRKRIDVSNSGGSDLTDFQISFTLDTTDTNKFQGNCEDLRVTGVDGNLLPFWIEENNPGCGDANTKVWVKLPSIPSSGTYIYAYYGNPSASVSSDHDGEKVFVMFDDFSTDNDSWNDYAGTSSIGSGSLTFSPDSSSNWNHTTTTQQDQLTSINSYVVEHRYHSNPSAGGTVFRYSDQSNWWGIEMHNNRVIIRGIINGSDTTKTNPSFTFTPGEDFILTSKYDSSNHSFTILVDGTQAVSTTMTDSHQLATNNAIGIVDHNGFGPSSSDWILVRQYTSTDPSTSTQSEEIGPGPIAYWKFDEGTGNTANDSSSNAHHGTISGATWQTDDECISGTCLYFDGTDDQVSIPDHIQLQFINSSYSVSLWVKPIEAKSQTMLAKGQGTFRQGYHISASSDRYRFMYSDTYDTTDHNFFGTHYYNTNEWAHITMVVNKNVNTMYGYVNGKSVGSMDISGISEDNNAGYSLLIGRSGSYLFNGYIDEVKIFPYALTEDQIKNEYNLGTSSTIGSGSNATPSARPDDSIIAHWSLDEQTGQTAYDKINDYSLTLGADTNPNTDDPTWKPSTDCKINGCLEFASGKYARRNLSVPQDHSISFWTKPSVISGTQNLFSFQNLHYVVRLLSTGKIGFQTHDGSSYQYCNGNTSIDTTNYHHILVTYDSTTETKKIYIDGELDVSCTQGNYVAGLTNRIFTIGGVNTDFNFSGIIDEFKIYNSALTSGQIKQDMNAGSTLAVGTTTSEAADLDDGEGNPPIAEWKFDEKTGSTANDTSGNNNTGTITGATWKSAKDCKIGACLEFNGDDYISCQSSSEITALSAFTVEAWVKTTSTTYNPIISLNNTYYGVHIPWSNGRPLIYLGPSNYRYFSSDTPTTVSDGDWHHIAAIITGNQQSDINNAKLYIDGKEQNIYSTTSSGAPDSISLCRIARAGGFYNTGLIDHVKIYDYARTPAQIAYDYNRGEPIAHWKMDECQGSTIHDSSDNGNHGTWNGSGGTQTSVGTCTTAGTAWGNGATGKFGASLNFDGEDDYINMGTQSIYNIVPDDTKAGSLSFWIKTTDSNESIIDTKNAGSNTAGYDMRVASNGAAHLRVANGSAQQSTTSNKLINDGQWHHVIGIIDRISSKLLIYIDGSLDKEITLTLTGSFSTSKFLAIGSYGVNAGNGNINAQLDDIRIYNYALSATQVKKVMNEGSALRFGD